MTDGERQEETRYYPMEFVFPPGVATRVATNILAQHTEDVFFISFFEARPPIIFQDLPEEWEKIKSVKAECVARVAIPASRMEALLGAMVANLDRWKETHGQNNDTPEEAP